MRLSEVRSAMSEFATRFDPALVSARDAEGVLDDAAAIKNMAATIEALAATRVAETGVWREHGDRTAAHDLSRRTGTTVGQAKQALETGRALRDLPATAEAAKQGELSAQQTAAIADAATADPDAEGQLLEAAGSGSLGELRDACARTKANACDLEARRRRIHERRCLRSWTDAEGVGNLLLRDNPEKVAEIMARVAPVRDRLARKGGEPLEAHAADALHQIACCGSPAAKNGSTKILARVDLTALLRGYPIGDETCELAGYGPVAVSALRDLIDTGDPFLAAVVTKGEEVVGVAHLGRRPTARQRSALEWLYPTCAAEGCNALTFLEFDHRDDWATTRRTVFDLLDRLCRHHHDLKTRDGWGLAEGRGKRAFVAPDDPRHPRHRDPPVAA
jgi:hypothetical protein